MQINKLCLLAVCLVFSGTISSWAISPDVKEMEAAGAWIQDHWFSAPGAAEPFSLVYDGVTSRQFLPAWQSKVTLRSLDQGRVQRIHTFTDPAGALEVRCEVVEYTKYPAVEWVVYFKNNSDNNTPILKDVQSMDLSFPARDDGPCVIHHAEGSNAGLTDFRPRTTVLSSPGELTIFSHGHPEPVGVRGGSSSVESLPFFNVEGSGQGMIAGIGWTGTWKANFTRPAGQPLAIRAGMDRMELSLHPGEQIRTPRILVLFWQQDRFRGHNLWRRLLLEYYSPQPGGQRFPGLLCDANWGYLPAAEHIRELNWWPDHDIPMECHWVDACWSGVSSADSWVQMLSNRAVRPDLYPNGMKEVSDAAHSKNRKLLLWFVPHAIHPAVELGKEHPAWIGELLPLNEGYYFWDHGDPKVNEFMIGYYSKIITDYGIDIFREDGRPYWNSDDKPGRIGAQQAHYIEGYYAFRDGLLRHHPKLLIDNCGEGGKKIDLETISRTIALWRSDSQAGGNFDPILSQAYTHGLSLWIPLFGSAIPGDNPNLYAIRSAYSTATLIVWAENSDLDRRWANPRIDLDVLRRGFKEYLAVRENCFGDYYPLTPYSTEPDSWLAWQRHRPEAGQGMIQAFRRQQSNAFGGQFKLFGLEASSHYELNDLDNPQKTIVTGQELMQKGIKVFMEEMPGAAVILYKKVE
ncbi:MAG: Alpha-galactosidase [Planctomycetes bacterium ADurb.Bin412]|nr:MAG: Alpha-galactosidase [Planctomycetes bacterium ADurb.Bin412]